MRLLIFLSLLFAVRLDAQSSLLSDPISIPGTSTAYSRGFYDMHRNVAEWTLDTYNANYFTRLDTPISKAERDAFFENAIKE